MFIVQGVSDMLFDEEQIRAAERAYDALLHETPGMIWNLYLAGVANPRRTIHLQGWVDQAASEAFGVSPGWQALRSQFLSPRGPRTRMVGPLSPGYWSPVVVVERAPAPTGHEPDPLGIADHAMMFVRPGAEAEVIARERAALAQLDATEGWYWGLLAQNRGRPDALIRVVLWRDDAAADAAPPWTPPSTVQTLERGRYRAILASAWPERDPATRRR
ncbi:MAG: hypothetical protein NZ518_02750 [Dehalococcoidia bacterium]|nr:hypothetical protein [Dehalococcoidia bacterium]